jgi:hypothetical protein
MHPHCPRPIELQRPVDFEEMKVRSDLRGAIARVLDRHRIGTPPGVDLDITFTEKDLSWNRCHVALLLSDQAIGW